LRRYLALTDPCFRLGGGEGGEKAGGGAGSSSGSKSTCRNRWGIPSGPGKQGFFPVVLNCVVSGGVMVIQ